MVQTKHCHMFGLSIGKQMHPYLEATYLEGTFAFFNIEL